MDDKTQRHIILFIFFSSLIIGVILMTRQDAKNEQHGSSPTTPSPAQQVQYQNETNQKLHEMEQEILQQEEQRRQQMLRYVAPPAYNRQNAAPTPDDAYDEGYNNGYDQGMEDGRGGLSYEAGYDNSSDYYNHYETMYIDGYDSGYEDGYQEGHAAYQTAVEQEDEDVWY